jgi:Ca2+/H+ antiporter, TMEM165/GDT1 family
MSGALIAMATFLAAGVEWVEALTIVLAVGMVKSWRIAIVATVAALAVLILLVLAFGFTVTSLFVSVAVVRTLVGIFLLLFGLGWLYKAILRSTGLKALHDEAEVYEETKEEVMTHGHAFGTAFGGVFLEGLEVVFIVVALGGLKSQSAAATGALLSLLVVAGAGVFVRRPLTRVPENTVKYAVGLMLTSFGTFFAGEGLGVVWWHADLVLLPLIAGYAAASFIFVQYLRHWRDFKLSLIGLSPITRPLRGAVLEVWGLFVTDGQLAIFAVAALLFVPVFIDRFNGPGTAAGPILVAGVLLAIAVALRTAARADARVARNATVARPSESVSGELQDRSAIAEEGGV